MPEKWLINFQWEFKFLFYVQSYCDVYRNYELSLTRAKENLEIALTSGTVYKALKAYQNSVKDAEETMEMVNDLQRNVDDTMQIIDDWSDLVI